MTADLFSLAHARQLRDEGMERAIRNSAAKSWLELARQHAIMMLSNVYTPNPPIGADDVLRVCPRPDYVSPNTVGSLFKDKRFKLVGYKQSTKTSAHARRIGIYQLNDGDSK